MHVLEIYATINGELPHIGTPTSVLRLAGCNLECAYCDAPTEGSYELNNKEIFEKLLALGHRRVLITGGEPLLQMTELLQLLAVLAHAEFEVLIETNGTLLIEKVIPYAGIALDVKLFDLASFKLENLMYLNPEDALKFVYSGQDELTTAFEFINANVPLGAPYMVVFSPTDPSHCYMNDILAFHQAHPFMDVRLQAQMHKVLGVA